MTRKKILAGNWKMFKTIGETQQFLEEILPHVEKAKDHVQVMIAPSFPSLSLASALVKGSPLWIGAQNMHEAEEGGFTGEVSARMLTDAGARFVILGHSERRKLFGETDAFISKKMKQALKHNLSPILCIGETQEERDGAMTEKVLSRQLETALEGLSSVDVQNLIVAYEPVWAIGTGRSATPEMAEETHAFCRSWLGKKFGDSFASQIAILYGGSVTPDTIKALVSKPNIDGALVGGASLKIESFAKMMQL